MLEAGHAEPTKHANLVDSKTSSPTPLDERPLLQADKLDTIDEKVDNKIESRIPAPGIPKGSKSVQELMLWAQQQPPLRLAREAAEAAAAATGSKPSDEPDATGCRGKKYVKRSEDSEEEERPPKRQLVNPAPKVDVEIVEGETPAKVLKGADSAEWMARNRHLKDTTTNKQNHRNCK